MYVLRPVFGSNRLPQSVQNTRDPIAAMVNRQLLQSQSFHVLRASVKMVEVSCKKIVKQERRGRLPGEARSALGFGFGIA